MDWVKAMEDYGQALKSVALTLFALAGLAERAALAPGPVRGFALWILHRAEAVAREFVEAEAGIAGARRPSAPVALWRDGGSPADAMRLARRLRGLAAAARRLSAGQRRRLRRLLARERERFAGLSPAPAPRPETLPDRIEASLKPFAMPGAAPTGPTVGPPIGPPIGIDSS